MGIQEFNIIMLVWNLLYFAILIYCSVNAIRSLKMQKKNFLVSYVLEAVMILLNFAFMYIIEMGYIDYGEDMFSGFNAMGDWLGFFILIIFTGIPVLITLFCHIRSVMKKR